MPYIRRMANTTDMDTFFDAWTLKHLDAWLDKEVYGDTCRAETRAAMLKQAEIDAEWYSNQSWWKLYDDAKCEQIAAKYR